MTRGGVSAPFSFKGKTDEVRRHLGLLSEK